MTSVSINSALKGFVPQLTLGCVSATVNMSRHSEPLWVEINQLLGRLTATFQPDQVNSIPQIAAMRNAYKTLGKDPSRYRGSAEALLRRVLAGKGLYQVNTVVDINNLFSLETLLPVGSYDLVHVSAPVELRIGQTGESYKGIRKDQINIENLPVFADANGPFGSPTSDSERAMIRPESKEILMAIFSFVGENGLDDATSHAADLLRRHAQAENVEIKVVK
ncbi:MAG TPA: phenylalanine--tRNA ligase beta subunit-related protein [Terriglobales bacterium]|jgi:DNA/RNA-binding domain of Phe-tRNA-synthetase-like protein|nr:phenylalanine--tRNA ligase beta subunit-related protein [Terriglobales bacterium]